jgi:ATP-dependent DNA helicase RecG
LTGEPLSLDDIMMAVDYSNKKSFRDNYVNPLEQLQWIEKTNPQNPTAPDQKYKIAHKKLPQKCWSFFCFLFKNFTH